MSGKRWGMAWWVVTRDGPAHVKRLFTIAGRAVDPAELATFGPYREKRTADAMLELYLRGVAETAAAELAAHMKTFDDWVDAWPAQIGESMPSAPIDVRQVIHALERMYTQQMAHADKLHDEGDYSAEFPFEDAERMREAIILLSAKPACNDSFEAEMLRRGFTVEVTGVWAQRGTNQPTDSERLAWLHKPNRDAEGHEYGVCKVLHDEHGQLVSCLWTGGDHSDIDPLVIAARGASGS